MAEVETTRDGAVLTIALNRPDKLNAFDARDSTRRSRPRSRRRADPEVRAVVLTGSGRGFCVGQDLDGASAEATGDVAERLRERWNRHVLGLHGLEKPVLAAVNGAAAGAGLSLACACDLRHRGRQGQRSSPPSSTSGSSRTRAGRGFVPRLLGYARAFEWMCSGRKIDAQEALAWGLVSEVVEHGRAAGADAGACGRAGRDAHAGDRDDEAPASSARPPRRLEDQLELEAQLQAAATRTEDFAEGVAAFLEKREPRFSGR